MNNFSDLALSMSLARNLAAGGFKQPTPVQAQSIPPALEGRDIVATAQTGTGKTLAFLLPVLERITQQPAGKGVQAVILSPTRELALQIQEEFRKLAPGTGIRSAVAVGGLNENPQLAAIRQGAQVLIATPGRLCDYLQRRLVKLGTVRTFVLDEADRMLDMGFLPAIEQILESVPTERQTLLFSATIEPAVAHLIEKHVTNPVRISIGSTRAPAEGIHLRAYEVEHAAKTDLLHSLLGSEAGSFLVFSRTKHGADRLARRLSTAGVKAAAIHGDRSQNQRNQALRGFQDGFYRVLVATDVAARGIHVDDVAHVVNFDLPQVPEDFIHRVGRTGRAGRRGIASSFHTPSERGEIRRIERALSLKLERLPMPAPAENAAAAVAEPTVEAPAVVEVPAPAPKREFKGNNVGPKPSNKAGKKASAKPAHRGDARDDAKPWTRPQGKPFAKPFAKPFQKPFAKRFDEPESFADQKPRGKFGARPDHDTEQRSGFQRGPRGGSGFAPKSGPSFGQKSGQKFGPKNGSKFGPKPESRFGSRFDQDSGPVFDSHRGPKPSFRSAGPHASKQGRGQGFAPKAEGFGPRDGQKSGWKPNRRPDGPAQFESRSNGFSNNRQNGHASGPYKGPKQHGSFREGFGFSNPGDFVPSRKPRPAGKPFGQRPPAQSGGWRRFGSKP